MRDRRTFEASAIVDDRSAYVRVVVDDDRGLRAAGWVARPGLPSTVYVLRQPYVRLDYRHLDLIGEDLAADLAADPELERWTPVSAVTT